MERVKKDLLRKHALEIRQHPKSLKVFINVLFIYNNILTFKKFLKK